MAAGTLRERLSAYISEQAAWRSAKAMDYPGDMRNLRSAEHLKRLAEYAKGLPDDDLKLQALEAVQAPADLDVYLPGDNARYMLSRLGFHYEVTDFDGFLGRLGYRRGRRRHRLQPRGG